MSEKKLSLENLEVDSFDTLPDESAGRGTVVAHETVYTECWGGWVCTGNTGCVCDPTEWGQCTYMECGATGPEDSGCTGGPCCFASMGDGWCGGGGGSDY